MPTSPPPTGWDLSGAPTPEGEDLIAVGADLEPGTLLEAYRAGLFPMGLGVEGSGPIGWWSPDPRGVLLPGRLRVSRSLRRACTRFEVTVDTDFTAVMAGCADPSRSGAWITPEIEDAYLRLHQLGWAHSVEVRRGGELVGGLYGVAIGGLFAGESMFHRVTDASKVALVALVELLDARRPGVYDNQPAAPGETDQPAATPGPAWLVDVQWATPHLEGLGVAEVRRAQYLQALAQVLRRPLPEVFDSPGDSRAT